MPWNSKITPDDGEDREKDQRHHHHVRRLADAAMAMIVVVMPIASANRLGIEARLT